MTNFFSAEFSPRTVTKLLEINLRQTSGSRGFPQTTLELVRNNSPRQTFIRLNFLHEQFQNLSEEILTKTFLQLNFPRKQFRNFVEINIHDKIYSTELFLWTIPELVGSSHHGKTITKFLQELFISREIFSRKQLTAARFSAQKSEKVIQRRENLFVKFNRKLKVQSWKVELGHSRTFWNDFSLSDECFFCRDKLFLIARLSSKKFVRLLIFSKLFYRKILAPAKVGSLRFRVLLGEEFKPVTKFDAKRILEKVVNNLFNKVFRIYSAHTLPTAESGRWFRQPRFNCSFSFGFDHFWLLILFIFVITLELFTLLIPR